LVGIQNSLFTLALKNPFDYLYDLRTQNRGVAAAVVENSEMWRILEKVRTFYQENPDSDLPILAQTQADLPHPSPHHAPPFRMMG